LTSGTGLQNLMVRYAFLTEQVVEILNDKKVVGMFNPLWKMVAAKYTRINYQAKISPT
jgi:hypothetical protein